MLKKPRPKYKMLELIPRNHEPLEFKRFEIAHPPIQKVMANVSPLKENPKHKKKFQTFTSRTQGPTLKDLTFLYVKLFLAHVT
jgi:hypothetical protein